MNKFTQKFVRRFEMIQEKSVRLTISMPLSVFNLLEEVSEKNKRSKLISEAVKIYVQDFKRKALRERLIKGYQARAERDKSIVEEWSPLEQEAYDNHVITEETND